MKTLFVALAAAIGALSQAAPAQADPITVKTDFVFIVDASSSMGGEIAGVRNGFANFVAGLNGDPDIIVDARFAIVMFGGALN